jgi:hypothetical protein
VVFLSVLAAISQLKVYQIILNAQVSKHRRIALYPIIGYGSTLFFVLELSKEMTIISYGTNLPELATIA